MRFIVVDISIVILCALAPRGLQLVVIEVKLCLHLLKCLVTVPWIIFLILLLSLSTFLSKLDIA